MSVEKHSCAGSLGRRLKKLNIQISGLRVSKLSAARTAAARCVENEGTRLLHDYLSGSAEGFERTRGFGDIIERIEDDEVERLAGLDNEGSGVAHVDKALTERLGIEELLELPHHDVILMEILVDASATVGDAHKLAAHLDRAVGRLNLSRDETPPPGTVDGLLKDFAVVALAFFLFPDCVGGC